MILQLRALARSANPVTLFLLLCAGCILSPTAPDAPIPSSLSVSPTWLNLGVGESAVAGARVLDQNQLPILDPALSWSSSDQAVAGVSAGGEITAFSLGRAVITVTMGALSSTINVAVHDDRAALVVFYNALNGPNWKTNANWLSTLPLDKWHGVTLDQGGRVVQLSLVGNELAGRIPRQLAYMDELAVLRLEGNSISGQIPPELGGLEHLAGLMLSDNSIGGTIPEELGEISSLVRLDLSHNQLHGAIPSSLGFLSDLIFLHLNHNQISGEIPPSLGNLSNLKTLSLESNRISGRIPSTLGKPSLIWLYLQDNRLIGNIPPELARNSRLQFLRLSNNDLMRGALPLELINSRLSVLDVEGTGLCAPPDPRLLGIIASRDWKVPVCTGN